MIKKTVLWILVISWALLIFVFSSQVRENSNETSLSASEYVIAFMVKLNIIDIPADTNGEAYIKLLAGEINNFVRKAAHFTIYLIFGILVYMLAECYFYSKKALIISLFVCLLYATSDEIHQLFVPGRGGMLRDVILDFSGSVTGVILLNIKKIFKIA